MSPTDVVVVGAGVLGCAVAHQLVTDGRSVALIDQGPLAGATSGAAAAIATPIVRDPRQRAASVASRAWYARHRAEHPDAPLRLVRPVYLVTQGGEARLRAQCTDPLTQTSTPSLPQWARVPAGYRTFIGPAVAHARLIPLCRWWTHLNANLTTYTGTGPVRWRPVRTGWEILLPDGRTLTGSTIVLATGAWLSSDQVPRTVGLRTKKIVSWHVDLPASPDDPLIHLNDQGAFLLPQPDLGQWWLSITSPDWNRSPGDPALSPTSAERDTAENLLRLVAPAAVNRLRGSSVGVDAYTPAGPQVVAAQPGLLIATGSSGSGFHYAPAVAAAVSLLAAAREKAHT